MNVKGDGSCLISFHLDVVWNNRFPSEKKPGMNPATFGVVNDLKAFISQNNNEMLQNVFDIYADQEVNYFIKKR